MESIVLKTCHLEKRYGKSHILHDINLTLKKGHIYGFIGENGAGKSTLLKIIAGLSFPTSGELHLFGHYKPKELEQARKRIGCTIEEPTFYSMYSASKNVEIQRILAGNPDKEIVKQCLTMVGLNDVEKKKTSTFSTGMKQRLSLAMSLVNEPELLLLDEPVNGLDPRGIVELRKILKDINERYQTTILISSHILDELYQLATDYIMIHHGKIINTLTQKELDKKCRKAIVICMDKLEQGVIVLEKKLHATDYKVLENGSVLFYHDNLDEAKVAKVLYENGIMVTHISVQEERLEDYYLSVIGGKDQ